MSENSSAFSQKLPVLKYIIAFLLLLVAFYSVYTSIWFNDFFIKPFVGVQTAIAGFLLNIFGYNTKAIGMQLISPENSLNVRKGCDGLEVIALYLSGVFLMPFSWRKKWNGIFTGLILLFLLNLLRIIALFLAQMYWPSAFEFLHLHGGFALFTVAAVFMWIRWANSGE